MFGVAMVGSGRTLSLPSLQSPSRVLPSQEKRTLKRLHSPQPLPARPLLPRAPVCVPALLQSPVQATFWQPVPFVSPAQFPAIFQGGVPTLVPLVTGPLSPWGIPWQLSSHAWGQTVHESRVPPGSLLGGVPGCSMSFHPEAHYNGQQCPGAGSAGSGGSSLVRAGSSASAMGSGCLAGAPSPVQARSGDGTIEAPGHEQCGTIVLDVYLVS